MTSRPLLSEEHEAFRAVVRRFLEREVVPHHAAWEQAGVVPRDLWKRAGEAGILCPTVSPEFGGAGGDFLFDVVMAQELQRVGASGPAFTLHSTIVVPYIEKYGTAAQKQRWLPPAVAGDLITAIAMTEPGTGSDLQAIATRARRDGNDYVIDGSKTFISNGQLADLIIVVARSGEDAASKSMSLFLVESTRTGFARGRNLQKLGMRAQDTSELSFTGVRIPLENRLGEEGAGFGYLMNELPRERLIIAAWCLTSAEAAFEGAVEYTRQRHAFGQEIGAFQNTRFRLAEAKTEIEVGRAFVEQCLREYLDGNLDASRASMAKLWLSEMQGRVIDQCLQFYGGYGYMWETPIARAYADARVQRIYGGTSEIMKELIARSL
ncbi:MAG TPA: acyl-CoA dehydrogenase family protein [Steroidobacteraceae bacterium]|nr:acyl-CoA dehydrogenase family protein [Steroidobacteraceae bacterium]